MATELILPATGALATGDLPAVPATIASSGEHAVRRYIEFFTAQIRNRHTRRAYGLAASRFFAWCEQLGLPLSALQPVHVATYIEQLGQELTAPTVKQHLAAIRMLFDWLVIGQVVPHNPAHAVRGPKYVTARGKTPILAREDAKALIEAIPGS